VSKNNRENKRPTSVGYVNSFVPQPTRQIDSDHAVNTAYLHTGAFLWAFDKSYLIKTTLVGGSAAGAGLRRRRARVQIAVATLSGNSLGQTVHTHCASVHQAAKLVAALLRVAGVTAGLAESNGSLPPGLRLTSPAG